MIKTLIIDDENNSIELISNLLLESDKKFELAGTARSVETGYAAILKLAPDLVFLDVQMKDGTGFDLLRKFEAIDFKVIFITAFHEFAIEAFKFSAIDYLLKPLTALHFTSALHKAEQAIDAADINIRLTALLHNIASPEVKKKKIVLRTLERIYVINTDEITRFEADGSYTHVYLQDGKKVMVSRLLREFDELLSANGFIRVHQSHLINLEFIFCFEKSDNHIVMKDNSIIPVAARKKDAVIKLIQAF